jgi:hypothetical protein
MRAAGPVREAATPTEERSSPAFWSLPRGGGEAGGPGPFSELRTRALPEAKKKRSLALGLIANAN